MEMKNCGHALSVVVLFQLRGGVLLTAANVQPLFPTTLEPLPVKTTISSTQSTKARIICATWRPSLMSGTRSGSNSSMVGGVGRSGRLPMTITGSVGD